jgi:aminoglycoside 3-N-acetyltransferase
VSAAVLPGLRLAEELRALGLAAGDRVVVHSSLRAVGQLAGAPETVAQALLSVVGRSGLVVAPTFTYDNETFDPLLTPGRTGALAEFLRGQPGAVRSLHPFYSVAAVGAGASELCEGHHLVAATGPGSPLDRLADDGKVLLLGTGHTSNTTIHVGEFRAEVSYLDIPFDPEWPTAATIELGEGRSLDVSYEQFPGCSRAFGAIERSLRQRCAVRDGRVGRALAQLVSGRALVEETVALLRADEAALLCTDPGCFRCSRARARLGVYGPVEPEQR